MRIHGRSLLIMSFFGVLAVLSGVARAADYNRVVEIEWEKMEGAEEFEVQWGFTRNCVPEASFNKTQTERTKSEKWRKSLAAGNYCVRVRGYNAEGQPGPWTDPQKIEVLPKAPKGLEISDDVFTWDKVPYAKGYQVTVLDEKGNKIVSTRTTQPEFKLSDAVVNNTTYQKGVLQIQVQTLAEGVPPSTAIEGAFAISELMSAKAAESIRAEAQKQRLELRTEAKASPAENKVMPKPSPIPSPEPPQKFTFTGEKIVAPPTRDEWQKAKTPKQKQALRRRTVASARTQLIDQVERKHPPDLRVSLGPSYAAFEYRNSYEGSRKIGIAGSGVRMSLAVEYNRDRPLGAFATFDTMSVDLVKQKGEISALAAGLEYHLAMDHSWTSIFSLGAGIGYFEYPYFAAKRRQTDGTILPDYIFPLHLMGADVRLGYRYRLSDSWEFGAGADIWLSPTQQIFGEGVKAKADGAIFSANFSYKLGPSLEVEPGVFFGAREFSGTVSKEGAPFKSSLAETGGGVKAVYRVKAEEYRGPASEVPAYSSSLWDLKLGVLSSTSMSVMTRSTSDSNIPRDWSGNSRSLELGLIRKFSLRAPWYVGAGFDSGQTAFAGRSNPESAWHGYLGYETLLLRREDLRANMRLGAAQYNTVGVTSKGEQNRANGLGPELGLAFTKVWSNRWQSQIDAIMAPLLKVSSSGGGRAGTSYVWNTGFNMGFRMTGDFRVHAGFQWKRLRMVGGNSAGEPMSSIAYSEGQLRLGVSLGW